MLQNSRRLFYGSLRFTLSVFLFAFAIAAGFAQNLRVATWNVTTFTGFATGSSTVPDPRIADFQTAIYGTYQGRSMAPDLLIGQEFLSLNAVNRFVNLLNTAPGSPGDWATTTFYSGSDSSGQSAFFYRTSKVNNVSAVRIFDATGAGTSDPPRHVIRYDMNVLGGDPNTTLSTYSVHMKSGSGGALDNPVPTSDRGRRLKEAQIIRSDAQNLPSGRNFLVAGDFNIQSSEEDAFQELNGSTFNTGLFRDPINTPGTWNNNPAYRYVHTQDPAGQMDDRLDMMLLSSSLLDREGFDYLGNPIAPYSTSTWDDPNHSYRAWGNDGTSYDTGLRVAGNEMVGEDIAQALVNSAKNGGHLPVFLDLSFRSFASVPEPSSMGFLLVGIVSGAGITYRRWKR